MNRWRVRWSTRQLCCSAVLVATNRILALVTASQMASASVGVILVAFDVRLHVGRWHQSHGVAKCLELARPMMRRGAGLNADQAGRQLPEERQDVATLQLTADDQLA